MQAVETKIREERRFTITTLSLEFLDVSRSVVYKIVPENLYFVFSVGIQTTHSGAQKEEVCHFTELFDTLRGRGRPQTSRTTRELSNVLAGRFWIMHHTVPTLLRAISTFSGTSNTVLAGSVSVTTKK
ncbi:hypothetical protein TNCV_1266081 [Trichonephila clavipes]|nr:hypothetical protein TNCV_1266081 [Trichonephila clavipes]